MTSFRTFVLLLLTALAACEIPFVIGRWPTELTVTVSPGVARLVAGERMQFSATVTGDSYVDCTWAVDEPDGGTVNESGEYQAPATPGTYHVRATSIADSRASGVATVEVVPVGSSRWVAASWASWMRPQYPAEKVDFSAVTHLLIYHWVSTPSAEVTFAPGSELDETVVAGLVSRAHAAGRKALMVLGGWDDPSFAAAASEANRATFVASILGALDALQLDGLDLAWLADVNEADHIALVQALRRERPGLVLTVALGAADDSSSPEARFAAALAPSLDQVNIRTFGMSSACSGCLSWHTAPLLSVAGHTQSVASSVSAYLAAGVPKEKLGIAVGFQGQGWTLPVTGPGMDVTGTSTMELSYAVIASDFLTSAGAEVRWDDEAKAVHLMLPTPVMGARWVSFENAESIRAKGDFAKEQGLGGVLVYPVNSGCVNPETGANPLLDAVKEAFGPLR